MNQSMRDIQAVILCGGHGTRLRAVAEDRPKPMVEIGEKPILWHIMKYYSCYGVRRFILALGYQGDKIVDYFRNYRLHHHDLTVNTGENALPTIHGDGPARVEDWEVTLVHTGEQTMTGGRIKRLAPSVQGETFFATYSDGLSTVDLDRLLAFHRTSGRAATLTGTRLQTTFGLIDASETGLVSRFREKPTLSDYVNGGFFVFNRSVFDEIAGDQTVLEEGPFRALIDRQQLSMYRHDGFWHCMDHYKDYMSLNDAWNTGRAPWKIW